MDLLRNTVDGLLLGRELDADAWRSLLQDLTRPDREETAEAERSLTILARMVTGRETSDLEAMARSIPGDHEPLASLAKAVASSRTLDAASAASLNAYVHSAFALIPYLSEGRLVKPALQRLAGLQGRAIQLGGELPDFSAASMFTALANTLAKAQEDPSFLEGRPPCSLASVHARQEWGATR